MAIEIKLRIKGVLAQIDTELENFEDRLEYSDEVLQDEWENAKYDWAILLIPGVERLLEPGTIFTDDQKNQLRDYVQRLKKIKSRILEKGYEYPEIIDQVEI
jgi:hypothetical protein